MPTLIETVNSTAVQKKSVQSRCKPLSKMNISASVELKKSVDYHLVRVHLARVPVLFAEGCSDDGPIIIDKNYNRIGKLNCDFIPPVIVMSGASAFRTAKKEKKLITAAWVGKGALAPLRIMATDAISNSDLENKLRELIRDAYATKAKSTAMKQSYCGDYDMYPYIRDVYATDNYCIFSLGKAIYRQSYKVDKTSRNVTLDGAKVEVVQTYVDAPTADISSAGMKAAMNPMTIAEMLYDKPNAVAPAMGGFNGPLTQLSMVDMVTYGAPGSELNNPMLKMMLNVEDALEQYLAQLKTGWHKPVSMAGLVTPPQYVNAARETELALKARGVTPKNFSTMDFLKWQDKRLSIKAAEQKKLVNGETLFRDDFAYVGAPRDISTWHLPIASKSHVISSLVLNASCRAIPKSERTEVNETLAVAARGFGLNVTAGGPGSGPHPGYAGATAKDHMDLAGKHMTQRNKAAKQELTTTYALHNNAMAAHTKASQAIKKYTAGGDLDDFSNASKLSKNAFAATAKANESTLKVKTK